ncbi:hypothetical protein HPB52_021577 [Rhipicephalus sanguineus]|uniref:Uncharacterized protein n=1 Tax=Rhipicephalus sanguineus TaxID=34632 RepID=A0A9D4Q7N0_RHISA|nr:hypothetical protein HPB52_021577 [Rhipicephalus sanguineus]
MPGSTAGRGSAMSARVRAPELRGAFAEARAKSDNHKLHVINLFASSNYAGLAMLLAVVLSFPICSVLMLVTVSVMLVALTLTNYVCRPYENIIYDTADITQISLLDDTMRVIWPRERRGKWFGNFLAGSTLTTDWSILWELIP